MIKSYKLTRKRLLDCLSRKVDLKESGWLANQFRDVFQNEIYLRQKSVDDFLANLMRLLTSLSIKKVVLFDEKARRSTQGRVHEIKLTQNNMKKLSNEVDDIMGTNLYITDLDLECSWIVTICHEGDYHLAGDSGFVKTASKIFKIPGR